MGEISIVVCRYKGRGELILGCVYRRGRVRIEESVCVCIEERVCIYRRGRMCV